MKILTWLYTTLLLLTVSAQSYGADHHAPTQTFKVTPLSETVFLLRGKGGNIAVMKGKQGLVMIDADYQDMSSALALALTEYGGVEKVTYLINTHWHGDHTQGNDLIGHHAQIIAHDNVRTRLLTRQEVKLFNLVSEPYPVHALPSLTYNDTLSLFINEETVKIMHLPNGHTDSDSVVLLTKANIIHMGDHFFSGFFPFVDVESGGDVVQMAKNVASVLTMVDDDTVIIPGHGPVSDKAGLADFHEMLIGTTEEVSAMMAAGMTPEEIREEGLSLDWEEWGYGAISSEVWLGIIITSLQSD